VKPHAFALALTANGVIASSRKAWPCTIAARGPICCVIRSLEVIEHQSLRRQRMRARKSPPLSASCPAVSRMFKRLGLSKFSALEAADMSASRRAASGRP
jgi:hypothetical protein